VKSALRISAAIARIMAVVLVGLITVPLVLIYVVSMFGSMFVPGAHSWP
jgi:hypothetical protein